MSEKNELNYNHNDGLNAANKRLGTSYTDIDQFSRDEMIKLLTTVGLSDDDAETVYDHVMSGDGVIVVDVAVCKSNDG